VSSVLARVIGEVVVKELFPDPNCGMIPYVNYKG
jgi:hypothetical protein